MIELAAGIALGAAASTHCVVMCGPLMLAVRHASPVRPIGQRGSAFAIALYHAGRIIGYAALGVIVGTTGATLSATTQLGRVLPLAASGGLVLMAAGRAGLRLPDPLGARAARVVGRCLSAIRPHMASHPWLTAAGAGGLTAILPCGVLYAALLAAAALANPVEAAVFMMAYGAGTLPLLGLLAWSADRIPDVWRVRLRPLTPGVMLALAALLFLRALDTSPVAHAALHVH